MNGIGNSIVVLDLRDVGADVSPADARAIAAAPGLAYDQLMVLEAPRRPGAAAFMRIFNNDGSQSSACGNGTRCVAYVLTRGGAQDRLLLETDAGPLDCRRDGEFDFTVDMGAPGLGWREIPLRRAVEDTRAVALDAPDLPPELRVFAAVNMGNPHAVFRVARIGDHRLEVVGPRLETDPIFPLKANISLAEIVSPTRIELKVWERGAGATLACGTAACATLVGLARQGLVERAATVALPGGELRVDWRESDGHVLMSGPVEMEFEGRLDPSIFAGRT